MRGGLRPAQAFTVGKHHDVDTPPRYDHSGRHGPDAVQVKMAILLSAMAPTQRSSLYVRCLARLRWCHQLMSVTNALRFAHTMITAPRMFLPWDLRADDARQDGLENGKCELSPMRSRHPSIGIELSTLADRNAY